MADYRPQVVCTLGTPKRKWAGLGILNECSRMINRIIIASFKIIAFIASKLNLFKVEIWKVRKLPLGVP